MLLGSSCVGSIAALEQLCTRGLDVLVAGAVPVSTQALDSIAPIRATTELETLCVQSNIAFKGVRTRSDVAQALSGIRAKLVLSSCFPWRLPVDVLNAVAPRCLNIHPSRLPAWRGPDPLFWQLRAGYSLIPLSVHKIEHQIDTGAVVASSSISVVKTDSESSLQQRIAREGVELACQPDLDFSAVDAVDAGVPGRGAWHRSPLAPDYRVYPTWGVEHATRFIGLMAERGVPFSYSLPGQARVEFRRLLPENSEKSRGISINLADGAIRVLMKNRA